MTIKMSEKHTINLNLIHHLSNRSRIFFSCYWSISTFSRYRSLDLKAKLGKKFILFLSILYSNNSYIRPYSLHFKNAVFFIYMTRDWSYNTNRFYFEFKKALSIHFTDFVIFDVLVFFCAKWLLILYFNFQWQRQATLLVCPTIVGGPIVGLSNQVVGIIAMLLNNNAS